MCFGSTFISDGAYLPFGSAPPRPAKLWHAVQLVRNSSPPRVTCSSVALLTSYDSEAGTAGPGASEATYAARASISSCEYDGVLRGICAPGCIAGIRPVPTWKSTAAAPTPISDGPAILPSPLVPPSAFRPWQLAQPTAKSFLPSSICWDWGELSATALSGANAAYAEPTARRPNRSTTRPADRCRRRAERKRAGDKEGLFSLIGAGRWSRTGRSRPRRRSASSTTRRLPRRPVRG